MHDNTSKIQKKLESKLSPSRYTHTLGVASTCIALAMKYGCDLHKAEIAGLLHDCAKRFDEQIMLNKCKKYNISITESELKAPYLLHAKLGAFIAMHKFKVEDKEIINAILCHTTGKPHMTMLDKILYVADYIEPNRFKASNLEVIRKLAFEDLDEAMYQIMESTLNYLKSKNGPVDTMTEKAFQYYHQRKTKGEAYE